MLAQQLFFRPTRVVFVLRVPFTLWFLKLTPLPA